jgi:putative transcriptional regulator
MKRRTTKRSKFVARASPSFLDGHLLIAMPSMRDPRFARSVIYMCAHSDQGAMGLIINQQARDISFGELLVQTRVLRHDNATRLPPPIRRMPVHVGGPVDVERGFVLHSSEYIADSSTMPIDEGVALTSTIDILRAIANGRGPDRALLALGYAGWSPGQLERELQANGWLHVQATPELVFDVGIADKYGRALSAIGIDPAQLVSEAGHA